MIPIVPIVFFKSRRSHSLVECLLYIAGICYTLIVTRRCNSCKTALHFGRWIAAHTFKLPPSRPASLFGELPSYFLSYLCSCLRRGNLIAAARDIFKYLS